MDDQRFDAALRALQAGTTRRAGLAGALGALLGGRIGALAGSATPGRGDEARAQAGPESGGWRYQSQFGRGCGSTTRYCLDAPRGMSISADGTTAYVVDVSRVAVYSRNAGSTTWYYSHAFGNTCGSKRKNRHFCLGDTPQGLSVSADGTRAYVVDTRVDHRKNRIAVYSRNPGSTTWYFSHAFGSGNLKRPAGISVSEDELTTVVSDLGTSGIAMFTRPSIGSNDWVFSGNVNGGNLDVALSPDGLTLWGTTFDVLPRRYVLVWTRTSSSSTTWSINAKFGSYGSGDSNFKYPEGIAVSDDTLKVWVADSDNRRIAVWARPDKDSTAWSPSAQLSGFGTGASKLEYPYRVAVTPDGRTALVSGGQAVIPAGVVEVWTQS